ncbi:DNA-directed RNA polymerase subunit alpha [bacterium SM23_31]|nr:MAG: DNA-directed RNA polymerase subunit alpha [bacterium SM23_31]
MNTTTLTMPEIIELDESTYSNTFGRFIIQPLERGFGTTIGNSLRRVLLSYLSGAAITSIKIDSVLHEFSTIKGIREDVSEMILNLKEVRLKLINKRPEKVYLNFKGAGKFYAGDIGKNTKDFEILNPDLLIATMDEDTDFGMEIRIGRGRGYVTSEENKMLDQPIGTIPIDSIFSPILSVKYTVESTRVGQRIDYEKLIMEIRTDGSVTPDDALTYAGKILKDHIQLFINFEVEPEEDETPEIDEEVLRIRKLLKMSVDELELSVRAHNCLKTANIKSIADLVAKDEKTMLDFRNFGRKSLMELTKILEERGLHFGLNVDKYLRESND